MGRKWWRAAGAGLAVFALNALLSAVLAISIAWFAADAFDPSENAPARWLSAVVLSFLLVELAILGWKGLTVSAVTLTLVAVAVTVALAGAVAGAAAAAVAAVVALLVVGLQVYVAWRVHRPARVNNFETPGMGIY